MAVSGLVAVKLLVSPYSYFLGSLFIVASAYFAYKELDNRLDFKTIITEYRNRH
jgi:hypothetical protein